MTHDEMIAVIQAHKDGKVIQYRHAGSTAKWETVTIPSWSFSAFDYRTKPEKKVLYDIYNKNDAWETTCITLASAEYTVEAYDRSNPSGSPYRIVKMVEE